MSNEELCALAKGGDTEARNRLLETNLSFIRQQANKIYGQSGSGCLDVDDLIQEGCFGLMEAIDRFDPERGTKFLTYAVWWIRKFMQETVSIVTASDAVSLDELEDFSYFVQNLHGFQKLGLELNPDWLDEDEDISAWCGVLTEKWEGVCAAAIDIDSDSYVLFPTAAAQLADLQRLAGEIGHRIDAAERM